MGYQEYKIKYRSLLWGLVLVMAVGTSFAVARLSRPVLAKTPEARPLPDGATAAAFIPAVTDLVVPFGSLREVTERGEELRSVGLLVQLFLWRPAVLIFNRLRSYLSSLHYVFGYCIAINAP